MNTSRNEGRDGDVPAKNSTVVFLLGTIADTTWRMFIPSVGFTLLGVWADAQLGTKPWLMVAGIVVGCLGAYLLVAKQIKDIKRSSR